jgi:ABC-type nitrate/sulfonate/bicarbonate transport system substrate-binding protein
MINVIRRRSFIEGLGALSFSSAVFIDRARSQSGAPIVVKGAYAAPGLSFAAIFLADRLGLWAKNGISTQLKQVQGDPLSMVALTNHEADFAGTASTAPIIGWSKDIKTLSIGAFTGSLVAQYTARKDWLSRVGVSPKAALIDKLKAFKGARIGVATIGGGPAQYTRYLLRTVGIDPEQDAKILAVGFGAARMAALRTNQVDVTFGDSPEADQVELEGFGELFLNCAKEVPIFKEFPYTVALVTPDFANEQPDRVRQIAQTLAQANNLFKTNFGQTVDVLKQQFASVPPKAIERSLERDRSSYPQDCRMTTAMWENNVKVTLETKMISAPLPTQEGTLWTNKFVT